MFKHLLQLIAVIGLLSVTVSAQTALQITKRSTRNIPGMEAMPVGMMSPAMQKQMNDMASSTTVVYVKGPWMRTDVTAKAPTMTGAMENRTSTTILQCDKRRIVTFDSKKKKFHEGAIGGTRANGAPSGGAVVLSLEVVDTGERAKMFGFDVRHLKRTLTMTPGPTSCLKLAARIEFDGWYADLPGFSCPMDMARSESLGGGDCNPEFDLRVKGTPAGFAFKETKRILAGQMSMTIQETVIDVQRTSLLDELFAPPAGYSVSR